ncbi:VOC family protein [Kineococcus sp. SYSU DK002]|uniref:VOC family protein n=1 Tax=Kineococcus sp. SYSU DK002 TaxID=3383123 RepID=UPI003D7F1174
MAEHTGIRFGTVALDTPDPRGLAAFYGGLLGWEVDPGSDEEWVTLRGEGGGRLDFQLAPGHVAPTWPAGDVPQQAHLDLYVADFASTEPRVLALGGTLVEDDAQHRGWRVYTDPAGHPFCLCLDDA